RRWHAAVPEACQQGSAAVAVAAQVVAALMVTQWCGRPGCSTSARSAVPSPQVGARKCPDPLTIGTPWRPWRPAGAGRRHAPDGLPRAWAAAMFAPSKDKVTDCMPMNFLDFEQPIAELEAKIDELKFVSSDAEVNIGEEI